LAFTVWLIGIRKNLNKDVFGSGITVRALCRKVLRVLLDTKEPVIMVWVIWVNGNMLPVLKT
jgi:hypothetical protein